MKKIVVSLVLLATGIGLFGCGGDSAAPLASPLRGGAVQGTPLVLDNAVTTLAGTTTVGGYTDCTTGLGAAFQDPEGITTDGTSLYLTDTSNRLIRKVVIATGAVTTVAGTPGVQGADDNAVGPLGTTFDNPQDLTTDGTNLYVVDRDIHKIRKVSIATGAVTTFAGSGTGASVDNTNPLAASFNGPRGITTDGANLYVSDFFGNTIRKVSLATGAVTTIAGSGTVGADDNAAGLSATFNGPRGITTDGTNLYLSDTGNNKIRKIVISTGAVSTLAGSGAPAFADGTGAAAAFNAPVGLSTDGTSLYVVDRNNSRIRKIAIATGVVTTIAGNAADPAVSVDGTGEAAGFTSPYSVTTNGVSLFVTDGDQTVRKID